MIRRICWPGARTGLSTQLPFGTKPAYFILDFGGNFSAVPWTDIMVSDRGITEHLAHLDAALTRLKKAAFLLNKTKWEFFIQEVGYLGHVIDQDGLHKDPEEVKAVMEFKSPKDTKEVRAFVGLAIYNAKCCPSLAQCLNPLYELLKDDVKFVWRKNREKVFEMAKKLLSEVLVHYKLPVEIYCDAWNKGI